MEDMKRRILEMYREAAVDAFNALGKSSSYDQYQRELFAEMYGRRQAYARILKEIYDVPGSELQDILDEVNRRR